MPDFFTIEGLSDAKRALEELTRDMRRRVVRGALLAAARPIVQAAKANAPVRTGLVKKRIGTFTSKIKNGRKGEYGVYIKPRATRAARKTKNRAQDPYYYKFQEEGFHAVGGRRVGGGSRRRKATLAKLVRVGRARFIPGKAFIGRAFESQKYAAVKAFVAEIKKRIDLANRRR